VVATATSGGALNLCVANSDMLSSMRQLYRYVLGWKFDVDSNQHAHVPRHFSVYFMSFDDLAHTATVS